MKALRYNISADNLPEVDRKYWKYYDLKKVAVRYLHCGEYGEENKRPHYHACIFNFNFKDKKYFKSKNGYPLYTSELLDKCWGKGYGVIGALTYESAAYVARYIVKKVTIKDDDDVVKVLDMKTGEIKDIEPEYITMSRRPGIGAEWYNRFKEEIIKTDSVIIQGKEQKIPRYYDNKLEIEHPDELEIMKDERKRNSIQVDSKQLRIKEGCRKAKLNLVARGL